MCNLYSATTNQKAIRDLFKVTRDDTGNLPSLPAIFPDQTGITTNIRNTNSPHWGDGLAPESRCLVPFTSFCEYADAKPKKTPKWVRSG